MTLYFSVFKGISCPLDDELEQFQLTVKGEASSCESHDRSLTLEHSVIVTCRHSSLSCHDDTKPELRVTCRPDPAVAGRGRLAVTRSNVPCAQPGMSLTDELCTHESCCTATNNTLNYVQEM